MEHDKESLKKLEDLNIFDTSVDPQILKLSEKEREKLSKNFESAGYNLSSSADIENHTEKNKKNKKKKRKVSFFKKVVNFIKNLFSEFKFGENSNITSKEIKKIKSELTEFEKLFVDFKLGKIKKSLPLYLKSAYEVFSQIKTLFEEVYTENTEINLSEPIFFVRYISNLLSEDNKIKLKIFTKEYLSSLLDREKNPMVLLDTDIQEFENSVIIKEKAKLLKYVEPFERILSLLNFNFDSFFLKFSDSKKENNEKKSVFKDIDAYDIVDDLKKLNDYLRIINTNKLSEEVCEEFDKTFESLITDNPSVENEQSSDNEDKISEEEPEEDKIKIFSGKINEALEKINRLNEKNILDYIIQYFSEDKDYKGKTIKLNIIIIDKYLSLLKEKTKATFNQLEAYKREEKITSKICRFFKVRNFSDLIGVSNYDDKMNKILESRNIDKFRGVKKFTILKNFIEKYYKQGLEVSIKNLLVEGDFIDKSGQQEFSDAFYKIEQRQLDFESFEQILGDNSDQMSKVKTFLYTAMHDKTIKTIAKRKIQEIDNTCEDIVEDFVINLNLIYKYLEKCLRDSKSSRPVFIYNMKTIGGSNNRLFINNIIKSYEEITGFLEIIKNFVVIHERI